MANEYQSSNNIVPKELSINIDDDQVAATQTVTSDNTNVSNNDTVTINGRVYTFKTTLTGAVDEVLIGANADASLTALRTLINSGRAAVAASGILTSDETKPTAADTVVIGGKTYTFVAALTEAFATATLTAATANPTAGQVVVVGDVTYEFVASLTVDRGHGQSDPLELPNKILLGATKDATLENLVAAINGDTGEGETYSYGTVANPKVSAAAVGSSATVMTARTVGVVGNDIAKSENSGNLDWDGTGAVFTGGLDSIANEISLVGATADVVMGNLIAAINGATGAGTKYSSATVTHTQFTAGTLTAHAFTVTAITAGTAGNLLTKTEASTHLDWDGAGVVMTGGVALNSANADVTCGAVSVAHVITLTAVTAGFAGNAITLAKSAVTLTVGASVLAGAGATTGTSEAIGDEGGKLSTITVDAPALTGTITYKVQLIDASGDVLYESAATDENTITRFVVEEIVSPADQIRIVCTGGNVEDATEPFKVNLR